MSIEIDNPTGNKLYFRSVEVDSKWQCTTEKKVKVPVGTRWDLSNNGVNPYGSVSSFAEGNGGSWFCENWHTSSNPIEVDQELVVSWLEVALIGK